MNFTANFREDYGCERWMYGASCTRLNKRFPFNPNCKNTQVFRLFSPLDRKSLSISVFPHFYFKAKEKWIVYEKKIRSIYNPRFLKMKHSKHWKRELCRNQPKNTHYVIPLIFHPVLFKPTLWIVFHILYMTYTVYIYCILYIYTVCICHILYMTYPPYYIVLISRTKESSKRSIFFSLTFKWNSLPGFNIVNFKHNCYFYVKMYYNQMNRNN